jgi:hypothetical protein
VPYRIAAQEALARWRLANARLESAPPGTPDWTTAYLEGRLAKHQYQEAVEAARREHLPEPPSFDEASTAAEDPLV